ncbi:hypothetical protein MMC18_003964 [Xylographa bjoerkii]|nr:hypothetical protein [Xylographa bjoerkii]
MSYEYDCTIAFSKSVAEVDDFARDLLNCLRLKRASVQERARPVFFVCHSLGGIVVKKALILANDRPSQHKDVLDHVEGIAFMGVPRRGSDNAWWADFAATAVRISTLGTTTKSQILKVLQKESKTLMETSIAFVERGRDLEIYTFYETEMMEGMSHPVEPTDLEFVICLHFCLPSGRQKFCNSQLAK